MAKHGKKYKAAAALIDRDARYSLEDAIALAKRVAYANFDASLDIAVRLGVDPRHADQMVRGAVVLPSGTGRTIRVAVFADGEKANEAREAGADFVGSRDLVEKIKGGWLDFDKAIATPDMMRFVGPIGRILGPRGLMPNPKVGTVTMDVASAIRDMKAGRVEFRVDKAGIVHCCVGRKSFSEEAILANVVSLLETLQRLKPASAKGRYFQSITLAGTMAPGVKLDVNEVMESFKA
jgi:large subunit ribosomal protein L1